MFLEQLHQCEQKTFCLIRVKRSVGARGRQKSEGRSSVCSRRLTKAMQPKGEFLGGRFGGEPQGQEREQNAQHVCEHVHGISHDGQAV